MPVSSRENSTARLSIRNDGCVREFPRCRREFPKRSSRALSRPEPVQVPTTVREAKRGCPNSKVNEANQKGLLEKCSKKCPRSQTRARNNQDGYASSSPRAGRP